MKVTLFSFLPLLVSAYAVVVDKKTRGYLRPVLQIEKDESNFLNKKLNMQRTSGAVTSDEIT